MLPHTTAGLQGIVHGSMYSTSIVLRENHALKCLSSYRNKCQVERKWTLVTSDCVRMQHCELLTVEAAPARVCRDQTFA